MITMKKYEAPKLTVQDYVADSMIASAGPKNDNAGNNQNCWACRSTFGQIIGENICLGPNTPGC
jgi:hypothetical protein